MSVTLSIVVPVWNEAAVLPALYRRVCDVLEAEGVAWELLLVDDGSTDDSWLIVEALHRADPRVAGLQLSRNFGHQVAITAGIEHARGDAVVVMDADLQDPPEVVPEMLARWREGHDVVYGVREQRDDETVFKKATAALFYRVMRSLTPVAIPVDAGDFRLMSRRVVDALGKLPERNRYVRGLVAWVGFKQVAVPYRRAARHAGTTKYPLRKMLRLAGDAIVSFSAVPLRVAIGLGLALSAACFLWAGWATWGWFVHARQVPGWTSLIVAVLLVGGAQLVCLGIIGEYIGRIHDEVKKRPLYLVGEHLPSSATVAALRDTRVLRG